MDSYGFCTMSFCEWRSREKQDEDWLVPQVLGSQALSQLHPLFCLWLGKHRIQCGLSLLVRSNMLAIWSLVPVLEKAEEPEIKLPTSSGSSKKQESSRKTSISALWTMPKPLTVWITINCGKFWKRWEYQTTWPASWETCMQVRKQQLKLDMEQQTGSK